jgi:hypothetical protein
MKHWTVNSKIVCMLASLQGQQTVFKLLTVECVVKALRILNLSTTWSVCVAEAFCESTSPTIPLGARWI